MSKKPTDLIADDEDSGDSGVESQQSYASILKRLGVNIKGMSLDEVKNMIHQYTQEGLLKGAKIIDLKTGKARQTHKKESKDRVYTVKASEDKPMTEGELAKKKDSEYNKRSEQENAKKPSGPIFPTKPSGPGRG